MQLETKPAAELIVARREGDALLRRTRGTRFEALPGTRREVEAIASLFKEGTLLLGSDASEQELDALRSRKTLPEFSVIHLATHGKMDDLVPMHSRLLLSQDRLPDPAKELSIDRPVYDGTLTAGEVMSTWKLNADLVTLSACQTGLGRQSGGEGFVGFAQAFFLAGARSLLLSLWEVDDRATSLLMVRFYQNWLGKRDGLDKPMSKAEALHEAKEWLRARHQPASRCTTEGDWPRRDPRQGGQARSSPPLRASPLLGLLHPDGRSELILLRSLFRKEEIVVGDIGDTNNEHAHAAFCSVDDAGRDMNERALGNDLLDAIEHDMPFALKNVVQLC